MNDFIKKFEKEEAQVNRLFSSPLVKYVGITIVVGVLTFTCVFNFSLRDRINQLQTIVNVQNRQIDENQKALQKSIDSRVTEIRLLSDDLGLHVNELQNSVSETNREITKLKVLTNRSTKKSLTKKRR